MRQRCILVRQGGWIATILAGGMIAADGLGADGPARTTSQFFDREIPSIASQDLSIGYRASGAAGVVTQVDLWVTTDLGITWTKWSSTRPEGVMPAREGVGGSDASVTYHADGEGIFGFFLVLHNAAGASSPPPEPGTAPQRWIRVDLSAPVVKILSVRPSEEFDRIREVEIRWEVTDDNLHDRPVTVYYRSEQTRSYRVIAELQAAVSSFRWSVPREVSGRVEIKVAAVDRSGRRARAVYEGLRIAPPPVVAREDAGRPSTDPVGPVSADATRWTDFTAVSLVGELPAAYSEPDAGSANVDAKAASRARKEYDLGTWHRLRGEYELAIARYRQAVELDPRFHAARHDLAALLILGTGDGSDPDGSNCREAETQLKQILADDPEHRSALKSLALVQSRQRNYRSAAEALQKLLLLNPDDAEAWLHFGDVSLFMGDRPAAQTAWKKVELISGASAELRGRAKSRLDLYRLQSGGSGPSQR